MIGIILICAINWYSLCRVLISTIKVASLIFPQFQEIQVHYCFLQDHIITAILYWFCTWNKCLLRFQLSRVSHALRPFQFQLALDHSPGIQNYHSYYLKLQRTLSVSHKQIKNYPSKNNYWKHFENSRGILSCSAMKHTIHTCIRTSWSPRRSCRGE